MALVVGLCLVGACSTTETTEPSPSGRDVLAGPGATQSGVPPVSMAETGTPEVAAPGAEFEKVTEPPGRTIAMLDPARMPAGTQLEVVFEPFGIGPWGPDSLVVRLNEVVVASGDGEAPDVSSLVGVNAIVRLEPSVKNIVRTGGTYTGRLRAVSERDTIVLVVEQAQPRRQ